MRTTAMSGLLPLLSFLLVAAAGGGTDAKLTGVLEANSETAAAYWQAALPGSQIPLAVLDLFTPADDKIEVNIESIDAAKNESTQKSTVEDPLISKPRKLGMHSPVEKKTRTKEVELWKRPYSYGPRRKEAKQQRKNHKFPYSYGLDGERDDQKTEKFSYNYDPHQAGNDLSIQKFPYNYGPHQVGDDEKTQQFPYSYGPHQIRNNEKTQEFPYSYGLHQAGNDEKTPEFLYSYGPHQIRNNEKTQEFPYIYGLHQAGNDKKTPEFPYSYGPQQTENNEKTQEFPYSYGLHQAGNDEKTPEFLYNYGPQQTENDEKTQEFPYNYGPHQAGNDEKTRQYPYNYGPHQRGQDEKTQQFPYNYGPHKGGNNKKTQQFPYNYGPHHMGNDENTKKFPYSYGLHQSENDEKIQKFPYHYSPHQSGNDEKIQKFLYYYSPPQMGNDMKTEMFPYNYGPHQMENDDKIQKFPYNYGARTKFGERHAHVHYHGHGNGDAADIFFSEDILTQGSLVTPYIQPTTSRPVLLRRDVADSIPFSTKSFADVVAMFAPASLAMADDIRLTLDVCEHPRPIEGEKITCATSLESLVEFPVSELGTQDVRAFSSDVPREGTASWRYNITALRVVTDSSTKIATCHDMAYPYAVFYCHTVHTDSPTRTYMVTLASEDGGDSAVPAPAPAMEALAVCHLNTSKWDPNHPFFVKRHVKPGDTTVCHFLTRGSFLWAPAAITSGVVEQVAAQ